ncbi:MAG TPA: serine/threonine-protein kinase, partial [Gemmatimonas sp.]|nr:serine/threonine-protein kinase [Gemmatimonas sp.]
MTNDSLELELAATSDGIVEPLNGRYVVERELGRGGMAVVYLATDSTTGEQVALKLLDQEVGAALGAERFRREIRIASGLTHANILQVLDAGESNGQLYFTMPVVTGQSLHARLEREEQLPVDEAVRITREVAAALAYAHERGIVHRDIKPENILMQDGVALLADFGIARASSDLRATQMLTRTGMSLGTPTYMSPEQSTADRELDGRTDQYSLACVLYEMLAGQPPFTAKNAQALMARHLMEPVPSISIVRDTVPEQVEDAIMRALAKAPADRFATIAQFAEALGSPDTWTRSSGARTRLYTTMHTVPKKRFMTRTRINGALASLGLVATAFVGIWFFNRPRAVKPAVLLAIAPFNPLRSEYALWQEGMVDLLARNLDGAGPLGTVTPAVAIRGWNGRKADRTSARELAVRTGAQYAVYGSINAAPGSLVQLSASLLNVSNDSLWDGTWTGVDVQQLADSATRFVLGRLGESYPGGSDRSRSLGATSLEALKLFLQGEQQFRRTSWEPALASYSRAAALDTGFALPLRRMGQIIAFQRDNSDSLGLSYALRAGQLNHGLAPRDSFLVAADSLFAALAQRQSELSDWPKLRRLFATLDTATRRYPRDPEVWYAMGEAREHLGYGTAVDVTDEQVFEAFEKAIALDSGFAPAYIHGVELAFRLRGRDAGRRYADAYLALQPTDRDAEGIRLVERLTSPA